MCAGNRPARRSDNLRQPTVPVCALAYIRINPSQCVRLLQQINSDCRSFGRSAARNWEVCMLLDHSPLTYRELHTPSPKYASALYAPHAPKRNRILAALPAADFERLLPHLEAVEMPRAGWCTEPDNGKDGSTFLPRESLHGSTRRRPARPRHSRSREMKASSALHRSWEEKACRARRS